MFLLKFEHALKSPIIVLEMHMKGLKLFQSLYNILQLITSLFWENYAITRCTRLSVVT